MLPANLYLLNAVHFLSFDSDWPVHHYNIKYSIFTDIYNCKKNFPDLSPLSWPNPRRELSELSQDFISLCFQSQMACA